MKKLAKVLSLALVLVMVLSLGGTAWADGHTITIKVPTNDKAPHTFNAYQIFTGTIEQGDPAAAGTFTDETSGTSVYPNRTLFNAQWGSALTVPGDDDKSKARRELFVEKLVDAFTGNAAFDALASEDGGSKVYNIDPAAVAKAIGTIDENNATGLAALIAGFIKDYNDNNTNTIVPIVHTDRNPGVEDVVLTGLADGYYFIEDTVASGVTQPYAVSKYILQLLSDVTLKSKTEVPSSFKKVDDKDDSNGSEDTTTWQDSADYDVGDHVPYKLTAFIPTYVFDTFTSYNLSFVDDLSAGLTLDADSVKITAYQISGSIPDNGISSFDNKINGTDAFYTSEQSGSTVNWKPLVPTVSDTTNSKYSGGTVFTFDLGNIMDSENNEFYINKTSFYQDFTDHTKDASYVVVEIEYTAELNTNAVLNEEGNPNKSHIVYSRNPNNVNDMGSTPDDTVIVFTYQAVINKEDENHNPLTGADFRLDKLYKSYVVPSTGSFVKATVDGKNFLLAAPETGKAYTKTANGSVILVNEADKNKNGNTAVDYTAATANELLTDYYVELRLTKNEKDQPSIGQPAGTIFTSPKIDAGTYLVTETVTPAGYNAVGPKALVITATHEILANDPHLTGLSAEGWTLTSTAESGKITSTDGTFKTDVVNKSGTVLPTTGGVGTTLFYVFGSMLVIAAAVYFVTKKRSEVE